MDKITAPISVSEASELLGLSRRQITRLIGQGAFELVFKHSGIRGPYLLDRNEVLQYKAGDSNA